MKKVSIEQKRYILEDVFKVDEAERVVSVTRLTEDSESGEEGEGEAAPDSAPDVEGDGGTP